MTKKTALLILDGWGIGRNDNSNAIYKANTPVMDNLWEKYPHSVLRTHGELVGLPQGQMGNSEVGHLNIGAGRIVYQDLELINKSIRENSFAENLEFKNLISYCKQNNKPLHLIGLVSDGGVHSHINHLLHLIELCKNEKLNKVYIHVITDGRDTDPRSGKIFLKQVIDKTNENIMLSDVIGRYYAMDRDKRWERIKLAYDLYVSGIGEETEDFLIAFEKNYEKNITDEFIPPLKSVKNFGAIEEGDAVFCYNFRTDRCREITVALTQKDFPDFQMKKLKLYYVTMTNYDDTFEKVKIIFDKNNLNNTLGEVISNNGLTQLRSAETEKYPHVTFFFSGGREEPFPGEHRIMAQSPKVATYDLKPEMSAFELTEKVFDYVLENQPDFICLNFANPDMVGHTGVFEAIVKAVETIDQCVNKIVNLLVKNNYACIIIADHGNADYAINEDGSPNTAHTTNPVPCIMINSGFDKIREGKLADIAPTILKIMGLNKPIEMDGNSLV